MMNTLVLNLKLKYLIFYWSETFSGSSNFRMLNLIKLFDLITEV